MLTGAYSIHWARGDYRQRQQMANAHNCVAYCEQHFNSVASTSPEYACVIVAANASAKSKRWAETYLELLCGEFGMPNGGVLVGPPRGSGNVAHTRMPAILLEPMFISNHKWAMIAETGEGQDGLARVLAESIRRMFPGGGTVALSVGHKYKTSNPRDRGARSVHGSWEADLAESVLEAAAQMLEGQETPP